MRYLFKPTRFAILKRQPSVGKDVVKLEFSNIADGNVKGCDHSGKQFSSSQNVKHRFIL